MRFRQKHMGCRRGKRVCLVLRDGARVEGRFHELTDTRVVLAGGACYARNTICTFIILRGDKGADKRGEQ